uniref:Uncharacterized protein n=1 Tax=Glossina pallidipes TaxID=7398 RepID=A0A1A9ZAS6_GLOPL
MKSGYYILSSDISRRKHRDSLMLFTAAFMTVKSYDILIKKMQLSSVTSGYNVYIRAEKAARGVTDMQCHYDSDDVSCGVGRFCLQEYTHTPAPARLHLHNLRHVISSVISKGNKPNNSGNVTQCVLQQHYFDDDFHV